MITSVAEVMSIGLIVPYLTIVSNYENIGNTLISNFNIRLIMDLTEMQFLLVATAIFTIILLAATGFRVYLIYYQSKISALIGCELSNKVYSNIIYQNYENHCKRNSSEVIAVVVAKVDSTVYSIILPTFNMVSSSILLLSLLMYLMIFHFKLTIISFMLISIAYILIILPTRNIIKKSNELTANERSNQIRIIQESIGSIRDIIIESKQKEYIEIFSGTELLLRNSIARVQIIASLPKYFIETLGSISILLFIYTGVENGSLSISRLITTVGLLIVSAQRILPLAQQVYHSYMIVMANQKSLADVLEIANENEGYINYTDNSAPQISFSRALNMKNVSFKYQNEEKFALKNISIEINKGEIIGIVGDSGSGKSTLLDLLMGLLAPTSGHISLDNKITDLRNKNWHEKISHVPQRIFILDSGLMENIAITFSKESIDKSKLDDVISVAELKSIERKSIGENGNKLSGGQRQRIGIARGIYKNADVLFLDEATSALDEGTEERIIKKICNSRFNKEKTIIMISHRVSALKYCDKIIDVKNGSISGVFKYSEYLKMSKLE